MRFTHLTSKDYVVSNWSGGKTIQIAIAPEGAVYADRDFLWRVSSATADLDESDYTPLPDYERWLSVSDRPIRLQHDGGEVITLNPYGIHCFDGGAATRSWGRCVDFNLMLRKGKAEGSLQAVLLSGGQPLEPQGADTMLLYCAEGSGTVGEISLKAEEAVLVQDVKEDTVTVTGSGKFMLARMKG